MAEKLTWGYEDVEPDPVEALKLMREARFATPTHTQAKIVSNFELS